MSKKSQFVISSGKIAIRICPHGKSAKSPLLFSETAHDIANRSAYYFSLHAKHHETILYIKPPSRSIKKPFENVVSFQFYFFFVKSFFFYVFNSIDMLISKIIFKK
jgi:hypothetical protein